MQTSTAGNCDNPDNLFERWGWLYALCRERVFADHSELIESIMHESSRHECISSERTPILVEVGCGPGFYSLSLAQRFPHWRVIGMDRSSSLLRRAASRAASSCLSNCCFIHGDVTCAHDFPEQADLLLASRLLLILPDRLSVLHSMYMSLRPGGKLLIAEPLPGWRPAIALGSMKLLGTLGRTASRPGPRTASTHALSVKELVSLVQQLPGAHAKCWSDARYQYVLCEKPAKGDASIAVSTAPRDLADFPADIFINSIERKQA